MRGSGPGNGARSGDTTGRRPGRALVVTVVAAMVGLWSVSAVVNTPQEAFAYAYGDRPDCEVHSPRGLWQLSLHATADTECWVDCGLRSEKHQPPRSLEEYAANGGRDGRSIGPHPVTVNRTLTGWTAPGFWDQSCPGIAD